MFNPDIEIGEGFTVRSTAVLTGSYVPQTVFSLSRHNSLALQVNYVKGTETSMELKLEVSNDEGKTYAQQIAESTSSGTVTISLAERSFSSTGNYSLFVNPLRGKLARVQVKTSGGGPPFGSCAIIVYPCWS